VHSPSEVWLVRHGETAWTVSKQHTSRTDVELTPAGEDEARRLRDVLGGREFALVLTSPSSRAHRTAELAGFGDAEVEPLLVEVDYGEYEGRTSAQIHEERSDWYLWTDGSPGGETPADAGRRADRVIERIEAAGGPVLIFGHGHMSRIVAARLLGLDAADARLLMLDPGAVSIVGSEHERRAIRRWNWSPDPP
jgi:probable phosphoglycerate mutase